MCRGADAVVNSPGETPDEGDKLIQVFGADPTEGRAERNDGETKHILLPLDKEVLFPAPGKETVLHDPDGRKEL